MGAVRRLEPRRRRDHASVGAGIRRSAGLRADRRLRCELVLPPQLPGTQCNRVEVAVPRADVDGSGDDRRRRGDGQPGREEPRAVRASTPCSGSRSNGRGKCAARRGRTSASPTRRSANARRRFAIAGDRRRRQPQSRRGTRRARSARTSRGGRQPESSPRDGASGQRLPCPRTHTVALVGKSRPDAIVCVGFGRPLVKVTRRTRPPFDAGPQLTRGAEHTMWISTMYSVPSGAKAMPNGLAAVGSCPRCGDVDTWERATGDGRAVVVYPHHRRIADRRADRPTLTGRIARDRDRERQSTRRCPARRSTPADGQADRGRPGRSRPPSAATTRVRTARHCPRCRPSASLLRASGGRRCWGRSPCRRAGAVHRYRRHDVDRRHLRSVRRRCRRCRTSVANHSMSRPSSGGGNAPCAVPRSTANRLPREVERAARHRPVVVERAAVGRVGRDVAADRCARKRERTGNEDRLDETAVPVVHRFADRGFLDRLQTSGIVLRREGRVVADDEAAAVIGKDAQLSVRVPRRNQLSGLPRRDAEEVFLLVLVPVDGVRRPRRRLRTCRSIRPGNHRDRDPRRTRGVRTGRSGRSGDQQNDRDRGSDDTHT